MISMSGMSGMIIRVILNICYADFWYDDHFDQGDF